jgi:hypothetical protein
MLSGPSDHLDPIQVGKEKIYDEDIIALGAGKPDAALSLNSGIDFDIARCEPY